MSVTYKIQPVEFGEAVTPATGHTTINSLDRGVMLTVEKITEEDGVRDAQSVVMTLTLEQAEEMSRELAGAVALARFKRFMARGRAA